MRQPHRLKTYLLAFALVLTVPLLVGTGLAVWRFSESERLRLMSMAADAGQDISIRIDREISMRAAILQGLAATPAIYDDLNFFSQEARRLAATSGVHIVLFDVAGQQLVNTRTPPEQALPMTADPGLVREIVDKGTMVYVANLFFGQVSQAQQVQVAVPVMRGGKVYRILGSTILASRLVSLVSEDLQGPLYSTLLDRDGIVLARSQEPEKFIGKAFPGLAEQFVEDEGNTWLTNSQGDSIFAYYRRLPLSGWVIVAAIPQTALDGPLVRSIEILAALIAALLALAFGSAWLIALRLTFAHRSLIDAAAAVGDGRIPRFEATALHEVNLAAAALAAASLSVKQQAEKLTDANQNLERRVRARTKELMARAVEIKSKTALIETTLDTMNQGLMVIDAEGNVPICNLQARRLLDLPENLLDRHPPFSEIAGVAAGRGGSVQALVRLPHPERAAPKFEQVMPNGRILEIRTAPIQRGAGFVQTFSDITEERYNGRLLEEARIAAENANAAKSDFLANMSHEMRTPLNAILGYSDILLNRAHLKPDLRGSVERIRSAGTALLYLVNDVLELGKIEAGVIDIRLAPFALLDLIDQTLSIIRPSADRKALVLEFQSDVSMKGLRLGDRDRLRQVLLNLLGNAVKFTVSGGLKLSITGRMSNEGVQMLRFAVADTGIGIPEEDWGKLFQRFQQLDPSINRRFEGAGLGLAISKHLVEQMGGEIGFESVVGKGSLFWFDLPLEVAHPDQSEFFHPTPLAGAAARILIAEDIVVNQDVARELLQSAGYCVDVVSTGKAAVDAVLAGGYDLVLMDVSMPGMDGLTATRHIRRGPWNASRVPVIACTAHVLPNQIEAMRQAGIDAYLFKPLQRDELYGAIDRLLRSDRKEKREDDVPAGNGSGATASVSSLVALLGQSAVLAAIDVFLRELNALEIDDPLAGRDSAALAERAHAVIATASMFELTALAAACRDLEDACRHDAGIEFVINRMRPIVHSSVKKVEQLRNGLECDHQSSDMRQ